MRDNTIEYNFPIDCACGDSHVAIVSASYKRITALGRSRSSETVSCTLTYLCPKTNGKMETIFEADRSPGMDIKNIAIIGWQHG